MLFFQINILPILLLNLETRGTKAFFVCVKRVVVHSII